MHKFSLTVILIIIQLCSYSQSFILKGIIVDKNTNLPIPYATIQIEKSKFIIEADSLGSFSIEVTNTDTLIVSCIGYKDQKFPSTIKTNTILLEKKIFELEEIKIGPKEVASFGYTNYKTYLWQHGGTGMSRTEIATKIELPINIKRCKITKIYIKGKGFNKESPVRIHIYDVNENLEPGIELLKEDIVLVTDNKKNITEVSISDQNVIISANNFFISLQWIATKSLKTFETPKIAMTKSVKKPYTMIRSSDQIFNGKWMVRVNGAFMAISEAPKYGNSENMQISVDVEIL